MKKLTRAESRRLIRELVKKTGSYAKLAQLIEPNKKPPITRQSVYNWMLTGKIPVKRVSRLRYLNGENK